MAMSIGEIHAALTAPGQWLEISEESIRGVRTRAWKNAPSSLPALLRASRAHEDKVFSVYEDERTTFERHFRRVASLSHELVGRYGIRKGDRVAIAMRNYPEWPIAFFAATAAGAIAVPLNSWGTGEELAFGVRDSGAGLLIADGQRIARIRESMPAGELPAILAVRAQPSLDCEDLAGALGDSDANVDLPDIAISPEDDATIFYTSGTTGRPKGAVGTHRNICSNALSLAFANVRGILRSGEPLPDPSVSREQQAILASVPFFHVTGCHGVLIGTVAFGGKIVLMYKWDPERALELIERERISNIGGVPTMVAQLIDSPSFAKRDVSSVKSIGYGGAPAPTGLLRRIEEAFPGVVASNGYGLTETSSLSTLNSGSDYATRPESVGPAIPICEVKVVDSDGSELPLGTLGELWIRGSNVVRGYWNRPEANAVDWTDGWFHTGDLVRIDSEGFIQIIDRLKDIVIRGGENVYCAEVENVLFGHPAAKDVAVLGIPHPVLGEEVGAVVELHPGTELSERELKEYAALRLAAFKVPSKVWFRDAPLPRNAAGKVLKRGLRESLGASD